MQRRDLMWLAGLAAPGLCLSLPALAAERELRIGIQKYGSLVAAEGARAAGAAAGAAWLDRHLDRVSRRPAAARGPECRCHRLRHHRRGAADLRAGGRGAAALCRLRAAGAAGRGDPGAEGFADRRRGRPQGQEGRLQQGLERPVPAGAGARGGGARLCRHRARLPAAGRCPRRVRAWRRRRLGDLGPVPGRCPGRHRRPYAGRRHRAGQEPPVLPRRAVVRRRQAGDRPGASSPTSPRSIAGPPATPPRSRRSCRRAWASRRPVLQVALGPHGLRRAAARR